MHKRKEDLSEESNSSSDERNSDVDKRLTRSSVLGYSTQSASKNNPGISTRHKSQRESSKGVKALVNLEKGNNEIQESVVRSTSLNISQGVSQSMMISQQNFPRPNPSRHVKEDRILNINTFNRILTERTMKEGIRIDISSDLIRFVNNGLDTYMKNIIERLITISRSRNVNFNLFSKLAEKNPVFKIHTFNWESNQTNHMQPIFTMYKDLSIVFTKNMRNEIQMLERYHDLHMKKLKYEKFSLFKNKIEEITTLKEKEKAANVKTQAVEGTKPRTRKRESSLIKSFRNNIAKTQKKDELDQQKKDTLNTLDAFLDNKPRNVYPSNLSAPRYDVEMTSNIAESQNLEMCSKFSEVSKSEHPIGVNELNEVNMNIFKSNVPSQNTKIFTPVKRRITLKDLIFYLEAERRTPLQNLILHRAVLKLNQQSH